MVPLLSWELPRNIFPSPLFSPVGFLNHNLYQMQFYWGVNPLLFYYKRKKLLHLKKETNTNESIKEKNSTRFMRESLWL